MHAGLLALDAALAAAPFYPASRYLACHNRIQILRLYCTVQCRPAGARLGALG